MKLTSSEIKTGLAIEPQVTADSPVAINGVEIDRKGYDSIVITCLTGQTDGSPTAQSHVFKIQSSSTSGSGYADVSNGTPNVTITADSTGSEINLDLRAEARYLRVVCTPSFTGGTTPNIEVAASYALGEAKYKPAT